MSFTPSQTIADRYLTGCVKQNAKDRRQEPETQLVNDKEYYRKVKISRNDHARAYIDKLKHTNKGFHFFVSERRIFEGQPINRAILTHPETIVIQHNISDTTPRKRKYLEQLLQNLREQYPEAKLDSPNTGIYITGEQMQETAKALEVITNLKIKLNKKTGKIDINGGIASTKLDKILATIILDAEFKSQMQLFR